MVSYWLDFVLLALASFRLTRLLVYDKITAFLRKPFHKEITEIAPDGTVEEYIEIKGTGIRKWIGELLSCHWCTGVWSAAILYGGWVLFPQIGFPVVMILAIAGLASFLETVLSRIMDE